MIRKLSAVTAAAMLCSLALPALPASALSGSAVLTQGAEVLPGASRLFSVDVTNTDGSTLLGGQNINGVLVTLPANVGIRTVDGATAPAGWTVAKFDNGTSQSYLFRTDGVGIAPGARLPFTFPASVLAPLTRDQQGLFKVSVSADKGSTAKAAAGALTSTIRILDVEKEALRGLAPAGVTDGSGTAGQTLDYAVKVTNYARSAVTVTPALRSNSSSDTFGPARPAASASIPAGGSTEFVVPTTLGGSADRNAVFTATATATDSAATPDTAPFEVQAPARLNLAAGSLSPSVVRQGKTITFTAGATKTGKPALTGLTGSLSFAGNTIALAMPDAIADGGNKTLTFAPSTVTGADGKYDVDFAFRGVDGNGFPFLQENVKLLQAVTLDALAPVLTVTATLPTQPDGVQQTAAKSGDRINVSGTIDQANCDAALDFVELRTDNGQVVAVPVTKNGCTFSGGVNPAFAAGAKTFTIVAQATDGAGNPGTGASQVKEVDLEIPVFTFAQTRTSREILVRFTENGSTAVIGGCSPSQWSVDGELLVTAVRNSDGSACSTTAPGPNNDRVLVLARDKDQDFETNITYNPGTRPFVTPVKDGAAADALTKIVKTVVGVAPAPPVLVDVTRNAGKEKAVLDEGTYFTRFNGDDLLVTFSGARAGYKVQVLDGSGAVLRTGNLDQEGNGAINVPIGTDQTTYDRSLRLLNAQGIASVTTPFKVTLDQVVPALRSSTLAPDGRNISVLFTEKLQAGTDAAFNWEGWARDSNPDSETGRTVSPAEKVSGSGNTRTVTIQDTFTAANFGGADYLKRLAESIRYEDRAGNQLANTI